MGSRREFSPQTLSVLTALCARPTAWQHGYALARETRLKSGTLYPILIRLADRGLVEACWQEEPTPGRPRRHLYRLTADGLASGMAAIAGAEPAGAVLAEAKPTGTEGRPGMRPQRGRGVAVPAVP
jgi:PadR family transcriptional regulator, regulatory protein PadR